jgi:hypothetical protein
VSRLGLGLSRRKAASDFLGRSTPNVEIGGELHDIVFRHAQGVRKAREPVIRAVEAWPAPMGSYFASDFSFIASVASNRFR